MTVQPGPEGFHTLTPYLSVRDVGGLNDFLTAALDAEVTERLEGPAMAERAAQEE